MSWKHTKLGDSVTFRSLERIAQEKKLITNSEVVKTAAPRMDLSVSDSLTDNIIKLIAGLRADGMEKFAQELEDKFINYKRAQTLYETSKETGEDLIDSAHPDGSVDLKDVDGDATVETIIDQQKKDIDIVNKKPTGKLTTASQIIDAVKLSLGQFLEDKWVEGAKTMVSALDMALSGIQKYQSELKQASKSGLAPIGHLIDPINKSKEFFSSYTPDKGEVDLSDAGPWIKGKKAIDALIGHMNWMENEVLGWKYEASDEEVKSGKNKVGDFKKNVEGNIVKKPRNPDDAEWWKIFDQIKTIFKMALNLTFKSLHQFEGKEDVTKEVLKSDVFNNLNRLAYNLNIIKNKFNALDKTKIAKLSVNQQNFIKTFGVEINSAAIKSNEVAAGFNPSGKVSYDKNTVIYDLSYLSGEFKNSVLSDYFNNLKTIADLGQSQKKAFDDSYKAFKTIESWVNSVK